MNAAAKLDAMRSQPLSLGLTTGSGLSLAGERRRPKTYGMGMCGGAKKLTAKQKSSRARQRRKERDARRALAAAPNVYADPVGLVDAGQMYVPGRTISTKKAVQNFKKLLSKVSSESKKTRGLPPGFVDHNPDAYMIDAKGNAVFPARADNQLPEVNEFGQFLRKRKKDVCQQYGIDRGDNWTEIGTLTRNCNKAFANRFIKPKFPAKMDPELTRYLTGAVTGQKFGFKKRILEGLASALAVNQGAAVDPYQYYKPQSTNPWIMKMKQIGMRNQALPDDQKMSFNQVRAQAKLEYAWEKANPGQVYPGAAAGNDDDDDEDDEDTD